MTIVMHSYILFSHYHATAVALKRIVLLSLGCIHNLILNTLVSQCFFFSLGNRDISAPKNIGRKTRPPRSLVFLDLFVPHIHSKERNSDNERLN